MRFILIILLFASFSSKGQGKVWREYYEVNGFCGMSLKFYNDSTYLYETGCEGRSNVNFGKWIFDNHTIKLIPIEVSKLSSLISINEVNSNNEDSLITIKVIDSYGLPIEDFNLVIIPIGVEHSFINKPWQYSVKQKNNTNIVIKPFKTSKDGIVSIPYKKDGLIKLIDLNQLSDKVNVIKVSDLASRQLLIKLDLSNEIFRYQELKWITLSSNMILNHKKKLKFIKTASIRE